MALSALWGFIDASLRGCGQVMFQNNPLTGLLFLIGIAWGAWAAGTPAVLLGAVVGLLISTLTALLLQADETSLRSGLFGYNGLLVGAALPTLLHVDYILWIYIAIGASVTTVAFMAVANVMKTWDGPALTFPFVLVTWAMLLAAYAFARVPVSSLPNPIIPLHVTAAEAALQPATAAFWTGAILRGPAQVMFISNNVTGLIFLVALAVSSLPAAAFALLGSFVGVGVAVFFGADAVLIQSGLFGFSPVLTAIALGCTFYPPSWRVGLYALLGTVATVLAQAALDVALSPVGITSLTAPFVFTTWVFLLARVRLAANAPAT